MSNLKNKMVFNDEEFEFVVDITPVEGSSAFITSGAVYELKRSLSAFVDVTITPTISGGSSSVPTSGAVYDAISTLAKANTVTTISGKVTELQQAVVTLNTAVGDAENTDSILGRLADIESRLEILEALEE